MNNKLIALTISGQPIEAPPGLPTGGANTFANIISVALSALVVIGIISSLFFVVWGGFSWITSGGDKQKLDKARKMIIWAIIGIFILGLSFAIFNFFNEILGGRLFNSPPPVSPGAGGRP